MKRKPKFYDSFQFFWWACLLLGVCAGLLRFLNYRLDTQLTQAKTEATDAEEELLSIQKTPSYQKITFAHSLYQSAKDLPRSDHITTLINVLKEVQTIDEGDDTLILYDFTVNLDSIEISWRTSRLALLYYPKNHTREWLISTVSDLPFLDKIRIQTYLKEEEMYEFTLYANIILDEAPQQ